MDFEEMNHFVGESPESVEHTLSHYGLRTEAIYKDAAAYEPGGALAHIPPRTAFLVGIIIMCQLEERRRQELTGLTIVDLTDLLGGLEDPPTQPSPRGHEQRRRPRGTRGRR